MNESVKAPEPLLKAQRWANLLDSAVRIPVIGVRVGLDFLIGLIPGVGDAITLGIAFNIVRYARKLGAPKALIGAMLRNIALDFLLGLIPLLGDIIDIFFKANKANVKMLESWWLSQNHAQIKQHAHRQLEDWERQNN